MKSYTPEEIEEAVSAMVGAMNRSDLEQIVFSDWVEHLDCKADPDEIEDFMAAYWPEHPDNQ